MVEDNQRRSLKTRLPSWGVRQAAQGGAVLSLMFWSTAASASPADDRLIQTVTEVQEQLADVLLLSTASPQARNLLEDLSDDNGPLSGRIELLTVLPGAPMSALRAELRQRGLSCALHVRAGDDAGWELSSLGQCPASASLTVLDTGDAGDAAAVLQPRAGLSEADIDDYVAALPDNLQARLLIAAVGPDTEQMVLSLQETAALDLAVARLPTTGDPVHETQRALRQSAQDCALRISADDAGWSIAPFGDCGDREEALQVQLQPEALLAQYRAQQLQVSLVGPPEAARWDVRDGSGDALSAPSFASLVGDQDTTTQLLTEQRSALRASKGLRLGGLALTSSAFFPLLNMPDSTSAAEDRLWSSLVLLSTGLATVFIAPKAVDAINAKQEQPDNYYEREQALALVDQYNARLLPPPPADPPAPEEGATASPKEAAQPQEKEASP